MLKSHRTLIGQLKAVCGRMQTAVKPTLNQQHRSISALYITGDKAKENYVTIQPYMDYKGTFRNKESLEYSIAQRKLDIDLRSVLETYAKYQEVSSQILEVEKKRENIANKLRELKKSDATAGDCDTVKEQGKVLRMQLKTLKESFYPLEDEFAHAYLNLPNTLHDHCPTGGHEKLLYRNVVPSAKNGQTHLQRSDLIRFIDNNRYYLLREAADFDLCCTQALTRYFVETGDFQQTANPDFVRCVLLEANATPLEQYHKVVEHNLENTLNCAYLTGGGAFESFLGAVTKLCVYPAVLPLRYVSCGRSYQRAENVENVATNLYTATQSNAVQTFVATETAAEAHQQFEDILNLAVNFYQALNIPFRIVYMDAAALTPAESLRAVIEVYSPAEQRYVAVGRVSNYTDFVSKRILFTTRKQKDYHFLHLVGGPLLYTTRLIGALIENGVTLTQCKLLGQTDAIAERNAVDEFKNLFK